MTIKPPILKGDKVARFLPAPVRNVAVGGGGRYFILHLPKLQQLAVFDVNEAKITHSIPVTADKVQFAAGLEKLIVVSPDKDVIDAGAY